MLDEEIGKKRRVWALVFTPVFSRCSFVWLSFDQTLARRSTGPKQTVA
ncbi:MAG: hypothetical protein GY708_13910 [Actinomycetia bacterium]|nr:hypothetical protein [Actinomycetes bacterium]MCP4958195.1 hypothetical protein [Actinomycetes bacterium]